MKLYVLPPSPYAGRVKLFARLKGLSLPMLPPPGGLRSPEYRAINPIGKVPVLELDDGSFLPESIAICEYLEDSHPGGVSGLPGTPIERARARLVGRLYDLYCAAHSTVLMRNLGAADADLKLIAEALAGLETGLKHVERAMDEIGPYAAGGQISLGDCALFPPIVQMQLITVPVYGLPNPIAHGKMARWWQALLAQPIFAEFKTEYDAAVNEMKATRLGK
jgi:glutathione S-transferase